MADRRLDTFVRQYLETALWSSTDNSDESGGVPLDENYNVEDIDDESIEQAIKDCADFRGSNADDLANAGDDSQNGHDFWLTRNGHGAGFWDRGYGDVGERLSKAAEVYGECDAGVGDDGKIYLN